MVAALAKLHPVGMVDFMTPENELERQLLNDARLRAGLEWGTPRFGHPEGRVADHVATMLTGIESDDPLRADLRFLALIHDSFKADVRPHERWSRENDHAVLARRFAERYTSDERLLRTLELHDEPYWIWKTGGADGVGAFHALLERIPDVPLFLRFVELDASTAGKDRGLLAWVRAATGGARRLEPSRLAA